MKQNLSISVTQRQQNVHTAWTNSLSGADHEGQQKRARWSVVKAIVNTTRCSKYSSVSRQELNYVRSCCCCRCSYYCFSCHPTINVQPDLQRWSLITLPKEENLGNKRKPTHRVYLPSVSTFGLLLLLLSESFFHHFIMPTFFLRNFSIFHIFLIFFPNTWNLTNLIFLLLENFTNSDRTPPYWYISPIISKLWKSWGKGFSMRMIMVDGGGPLTIWEKGSLGW